MTERKIAINKVVCQDYYQQKQQKLLFNYAVVTSILAGRGFLRLPLLIKEITLHTNLSRRTAYRLIDNLKENKLLACDYHKGNKKKNVSPGVICRIKGRPYLEKSHEVDNKYIVVKGDMLKSYKDFNNGMIRQFAIMSQDAIEHSFKYLDKSEMATCGRESGSVDSLLLLRNKKQSGCSLSRLVKILNIDKRTASTALKGYTQKQSNKSLPIKGKVARKKYGSLLNAIAGDRRERYGVDPITFQPVKVFTKKADHTIQFQYDRNRDTYIFIGILSSRIVNVDRSYKTVRRRK